MVFHVTCQPIQNTAGTAGGPGGGDRTLAIKSRKTAGKKNLFFFKKTNLPPQIFFFFHISSSYAKIIGGNKFSHMGVSLKWVKNITMASYALQTPPRVAHTSHLGNLIKKLN